MYQPVLSIDVSKSTSYAATFLSYEKPHRKPFSFSHSPSDMQNLVSCLKSLEEITSIKPNVVLEATGNFSKPLVEFFENEGYHVITLNPLQTHQQKKKSIRKVKTDPIDANRIAQVYYLSDFKIPSKISNTVLDLRNLCRQYEGFNTLYTEAQLRFRSTLDLVFPNYDKVFSHLCCKTSLTLISNFPTPKAVLTAPKADLIAALKVSRLGDTWSNEKVDKLISAAKESLPIVSSQESYLRILKDYIEILLTHQRILTQLRDQILQWASLQSDYELLCSIPGVGPLTAATILGEIGDICNFPSSKQLVAFAGLDPSVYQSGKFTSRNNKISKRGSTYLRKALYQATVVGISNRKKGPVNEILFEFYSRKKSEGKASKVAIIATCNKLLRMIYGVMKNKVPYTVN